MSKKDEEEKYFERKQAEWRRQVRRQKRLEAIRQKEVHEIAEELETTEEVAEEALALGFDQNTARVLPLLPLIQVAWIDGEIQLGETRRINDLAHEYGIENGTEAHDFLDLLLQERPSDSYFERANRVIRHLLQAGNAKWDGDSIVDLAKTVAESSGSFFGLTDPIAPEEADLLDDFADEFDVHGQEAIDLKPDE
ncbi:MAG: hypothetical protein ABEL76_13580 [Bradymonadaceae bacterium]